MRSITSLDNFFETTILNEPNELLNCIISERLSQNKKKGCEIINISCEQIVAEYSDMVYRIALTHVKNKEDAEDIFQEVFISLTKNLNSIENKQHLKYWLIRTTINRCKNHNLCFWKQRVQLSQDAISFDTSDNTNELIDEVRNQISALNPKLRSVVYLYYYEEYSVNEISDILSIPVGTIKSRLYSARKLLKNKLKEAYRNEI